MVTKHERKGHDCGGNGRFARPGRFTTYSLARTIRRRLPVITYSANRAALRDCASCPSEVPTVRIKQHSGVRVSQKQAAFPIPPTRHHLIHVPCHNTNNHSNVSSPSFSQDSLSRPTRAAWQRPKTNEPTDGHRRYIFHRCEISAGIQREDHQRTDSLIKRGAKKWKT